jgi:C4-dicarboxylate transporter, DctM subunit
MTGQGRRRSVNLTSPFAIALIAIVVLSLLGLPIGLAMIGASVLYLYLKGADMGTAAEQLLNGTYGSFLLLAIPLFILAATFMSTGSIMDRLLRFCNAIVGRFPGGLAQVNVLQSIVFASMSGSALADAAGTGKLMQEMMTRGGKYTQGFRRGAVGGVGGDRADPAAVDPAGAVRAGLRHLDRLPVHGRRGAGAAAGRGADGLIYVLAKRRNFAVEEPCRCASCRASRGRRCRR